MPPETGEVEAAMVCDALGTQLKVSGVVIPVPSTVTKPEPGVLEVIVIATVPAPLTVKVAVPVLEDASVTLTV